MRLGFANRFRGGSGVSWPRLAAVLAVVLCALSLLVSALVPAAGGAQGQQDGMSPQPSQQDGDFRVFEFGSMEDRGEYVHCVSFVSPDEQDPSQLLPSDETCYKEEPEISDLDAAGSGAASAQSSSRNVILGKHYDYFGYGGPSLTVVGKGSCAGGGITLTGGRWDNRISSTRNGCSTIEHYTYSRPFVFSGAKQNTYGYGGNLNLVNNSVSGILYKGRLQAPPIRPTTIPPTTAAPPPPPLPPPPPPPQPQPPSRPQPVSNHNVAVTVEAIEVTQGVQDWNNSVRLVRGRPTVVRVFLEAASRNANNAVDVSANLTVSVVGSRGAQTLTATNEDGQVAVSSNVASRRWRLDSSLNFVLPETWTNRTSTERLRLSLAFGSGITTTCGSSAATNSPADAQQISVSGTCSVDVSFVDVLEPSFAFVPFVIVENDGTDHNRNCINVAQNASKSTRYYVNDDDLYEKIGRIYSNMPFAQNLTFSDSSNYAIRGPFKIGSNCKTEDLLNLLKGHRILEFNFVSSIPTFYAGVFPCGERWATTGAHGQADAEEGVAIWTLRDKKGDSNQCFSADIDHALFSRNVAPHEIGHLLGLHHPTRDTLQVSDDSSIKGEFAGVCGETAEVKSAFSYFNGVDIDGNGTIKDGRDQRSSVTEEEFWKISEDEFFATLGPIGDDVSERIKVWGFDVRLFLQRNSIIEARRNTLIISDPSKVFSLMSYCDAGASYTQVVWMYKFHHEKIVTSRSAAGSSSIALDATQTSQTSIISELISGIVDLSSSGSPVSVSLNPIHSRTTGSRVNPSGDYKLELLDASDSVLRSIPFNVGKIEVTCDNGACPASVEPNKALFGLVINEPPDYKKLRFSKSGTTFATLTRSASTPSVYGPVLLVPEPRAQAAGENILLTWPAFDDDNDDLKYTLFYSTDSGKTYSVLVMNTDDTSFSINPDSLEGSDTARIAVSVSDGLRAAFSESQIFSVTNKHPVARIAPLSSNETSNGGSISGRQSLVLSASGYDLEDKNLPSVAFSWRSSLDGDLGAGRHVVVSGADLTAGEHEITMTATDSAGNKVTDRTQITVSEYEILPEAIDDSASASLDDAVFVDVVANDINIDPDVARVSLSIVKGPDLGTATIAVSPDGLRSVKYTGHTSGIDTVGYKICDETDASNCSEAILSVSVAIGACTIIGTEGDDVLEGTTGNDVICGMGGDDRIDGKRGNDVIYGGSGNDTLYGRDGDDTIYGGSGDDLILGHRGNDVLYGRLGDDRIYGGGGDDIAAGGKGSDRLHGEADDDTLEGNQGNDVIHGGRGNDTIIGGEGDDTIRGNAGTDTIYLGEGTDTLLGTSPQDNVIN